MKYWAAILAICLLSFGANFWMAGGLDAPPKVRKFAFTLSDGSVYHGYGTEVRTSGLCSELVMGKVVTGIVCGQHVVSEVYDVPPKKPMGRTIV